MLTGLIFGIIVILWVIYLVPRSTLGGGRSSHRIDPDALGSVGESMQVVRDCRISDELPDSGFSVSTPLQRRAARFEIKRANQVAQQRRRIGFIANSLILLTTIILPFFFPISHWLTLGGVVLFAAGIALSAYSVKTMRKATKRQLDEIAGANDEHTLVIEVSEPALDSSERSINLTEQLENIDSLLAPLPVTPSTYISQPLLPRSVRTIDLSAPLPQQSPVTVEVPEPDHSAQERPRAVGE